MTPDLIFVYGSLKRGFRNHGLLAGSEFVGAGLTEARYRLLDLGAFPALFETSAEPLAITGELYRIDAATLERLDRLEDEGVLYRRVVAPITALDGGACDQRVVTYHAWIYVWLGATAELPVLETGTWKSGMTKDEWRKNDECPNDEW